MSGGRVYLLALVLLGGCVPPGTPRLPARATSTAPRIEPIMEGLSDETPIWDAQPVSATAVRDADGFRRHRVVAGETGIAIARAYGIRWNAIIIANGLTEPFLLRVGQRLLLPGRTSPNAEARAATFRIDIDDIATGATPATTIAGPVSEAVSRAFGGRFAWPLAGTVAERFGPAGEGRINRGIEIAGAPGSDIHAAADGTIAFVGNGGSAGYGGLLLVRHGNGWISVYGRAAKATVERGQVVQAGQTIGSTGGEGRLHFELRQNRAPVDPGRYLPAR